MQHLVQYTILFNYMYTYFSDIQKKILLLDLVNMISPLKTRQNTLTTEYQILDYIQTIVKLRTPMTSPYYG